MLLERAMAKEAELEVEKLASQSRKQRSQAEANGAEIAQLKHERQQHQEAINRCVSHAQACVCVCHMCNPCVCVCADCSMRLSSSSSSCVRVAVWWTLCRCRAECVQPTHTQVSSHTGEFTCSP